jgi:hypothetical protein
MRAIAVLFATVALTVVVTTAVWRADAQSLPPGYDQFTGVTLWGDGTTATVVLQSGGEPDHNSPYFFMTDPRYEPYNGPNPNYMQNPNHILPQTIELHIPLEPQEATVHQATPLGPIGVALNGVPFFNQYAGPNQPLTNEINSFDQYNGHPQQTGMYHYHVEPLALTAQYGEDALLGFLLDGFPVYGPMENGEEVTNADLDQYHGHSHATAEYPDGIYHYHVTAAAPYINGTGFYGTPGTVTYTFSPTPTAPPSPTPPPTLPAVGGLAEVGEQDGAAVENDTSSATPRVLVASAGAVAAGAAVVAATAWYRRRRVRR